MLDDLKVSKSLMCNQDTSLYNNNVRIVCLVKSRYKPDKIPHHIICSKAQYFFALSYYNTTKKL